MKYLKNFENTNESDWNKYIDETLSELTIYDLIHNTINLPSYYYDIKDEDMLKHYGTIDKDLHYFITNVKYERALWENYNFHYSVIFWRKIKYLVSKNIEELKENRFMSEILESYRGKMGNFDDI